MHNDLVFSFQIRIQLSRIQTRTMLTRRKCYVKKILILTALTIIIHFLVWENAVAETNGVDSGVNEPDKYMTSSYSLELRIKIAIFYSALNKYTSKKSSPWWYWAWSCFFGLLCKSNKYFEIEVLRSNIVNDSLMQITNASYKQLTAREFSVLFKGEIGEGRGSLKEWLSILSTKVFKPNSKYFEYTDEFKGIHTLQIRPMKEVKPEDKIFFRFLGRIFGVAMYRGLRIPNNTYLSKLIYSKILGKQIGLEDLKDVDPASYGTFSNIMNNDPSDWGMNFEVSAVDEKGKEFVHNLHPGMKSVSVDLSNKKEFVNSYIRWKFAPEEQTDAFLNGLYEIIPLYLLQKYFNEAELELLLCGIHEIDVKDWEENTTVTELAPITDEELMKKNTPPDTSEEEISETVKIKDGRVDPESKRIFLKWFWEIIGEFDYETKAKFLLYVTGSRSVPVGGFANINPRFEIELQPRAYYDGVANPPIVFTCQNIITLPVYNNKKTLKRELEQMLQGEPGGFNDQQANDDAGGRI